MNYLAHLYLAGDEPEALVGNLMGDFVKGPVPEELDERLRRGIVLHRRIDAFTDRHPIVGRSKRRLRPRFRRYGGILVDVFYDHFLARNWSRYSAVPLPAFARHVYRILEARYPELPARMQRSVAHMIANDLLLSYRELAGIERALRGIEGRLKRESGLHQALADLELNDAELGRDFEVFFPELVGYVESLRRSRDL